MGEIIQNILIALFVAIPPTIASLAIYRKSKTNEVKLNDLQATSDVIHELTNSNLTRVKADLTTALERVAALEALVQRLVDRPHDAAALRSPGIS